jgi:hypothetical protein
MKNFASLAEQYMRQSNSKKQPHVPETTAEIVKESNALANQTMIEPSSFEGPGEVPGQDSLMQRHLLQLDNRVRIQHLMDELRETPTEDEIIKTYNESTKLA